MPFANNQGGIQMYNNKSTFRVCNIGTQNVQNMNHVCLGGGGIISFYNNDFQ